MSVSHGNDPEILDRIGEALHVEADRVDGIAGTGTSGMAMLVESWAGPDLEAFDADWRGAQQQLAAVAQLLRVVGKRAKEQAQQQREGSGEGGGGRGVPWLSRTPGVDITLPSPGDPALVVPIKYDTPPDSGGGDRVPHSDKDQGDLEIPFPPGDEPWVPQGLGYSDEEDVYVHTFYNHDDSGQGMLAIQSADGTSVKYIPIEGNSHYGGVVVDGDHVYVSGNGGPDDEGSYVTRYSLDELMSAQEGEPVGSKGDPVPVETGSTLTVHEDKLYAANFSTKPQHGPAAVYEYSLDEDGGVISDDDPPSFRAPEGTQGITTQDGENFFFTSSKGFTTPSELIHLNRYDDENTTRLPVHLSPVSQGVVMRDGQFIVTNESDSDVYRHKVEAGDTGWLPNFMEQPEKPNGNLQNPDIPTLKDGRPEMYIPDLGGGWG